MRKLVQFMHISLDGFVARTGGEMDWIRVDDEMFEFAGQRTAAIRIARTFLAQSVHAEMLFGERR